MYEYAIFVFSTAALSILFSLVFFALFLVVLGPQFRTGEIHERLRPKALDHLLRKHRPSRKSIVEQMQFDLKPTIADPREVYQQEI